MSYNKSSKAKTYRRYFDEHDRRKNSFFKENKRNDAGFACKCAGSIAADSFEDGAERCIVMAGKSAGITVRTENGRQEIGDYDIVPEGRFFFGDRFLEYLKETL